MRGWRRGEYYTHVHTDELVEYLASHYQAGSPERDRAVGEALRLIDSPAIRGLLRTWAGLRGPSPDSSVRESGRRGLSETCFEALRDRGDESAIEFTLDERAGEPDDVYVWITSEFLGTFPPTAVADRLRLRLTAATTASGAVRMLALLGRFGAAVDADLARGFLDHPDDLVANVACETMLRLSDPLLVPDGWREM